MCIFDPEIRLEVVGRGNTRPQELEECSKMSHAESPEAEETSTESSSEQNSSRTRSRSSSRRVASHRKSKIQFSWRKSRSAQCTRIRSVIVCDCNAVQCNAACDADALINNEIIARIASVRIRMHLAMQIAHLLYMYCTLLYCTVNGNTTAE